MAILGNNGLYNIAGDILDIIRYVIDSQTNKVSNHTKPWKTLHVAFQNNFLRVFMHVLMYL